MPLFSPKTMSSAMIWAVTASPALIASLSVRECSASPTYKTVGPIEFINASTRSKVSRGPETINVTLPAERTAGLPLTGERR